MRILLYILFFFPLLVNGQLTDNFSDGDFTNNPTWSGDDAQFIVNASGQLQTSSTVAGSSYLSTPASFSSLNDFEWQFYIKQSFAPSAQNFSRIYLVSDQANLEGPLNGYYLRFGENLSLDAVELFKQTGTTSTSIARGTNSQVAASFAIRVKVTRDNTGLWSLSVDATGGTAFVLEDTGIDNTYNTSSFFGVATTYTMINGNKFFYDDFYAGPIIVDLTAPSLQSVTVISSTQVDVRFTETVESTSAQNINNYSVNNSIGNPSSVVLDAADFSLVHLTFAVPFASNVSNTLTVTGVQDLSANVMSSQSLNFTYVAPVVASYKDIVINEIMADPDPQVGLPNAEYVELYNRSTQAFNLNGWKLTDPTASGTIQNAILSPGGYLLLVKASDTALFSTVTNKVVVTSFPSLNNPSDIISLKDNTGLLIDRVDYSSSWYNSSIKDDGGWSLELINPTIPCGGASNWTASVNTTGGTPGAINSVYNNQPDTTKPKITKATAVTQNTVIVEFSENADSASVANAAYSIDQGVVIGFVQGFSPDFNKVSLSVTPFDSSKAYTVTVSGIMDCSGNTLLNGTAKFGLGTAPKRFDLVINEIMATPANSPGLPEAEFIELYNVSSKVLRIENFTISDAVSTGNIATAVMLPGEYLIICSSTNASSLSSYGNVASVTSWPTLNSTSDSLALRDSTSITIHSVNYSDEWYGDATKAGGGWSLEMIDPHNPCAEGDNWKASVDPLGGTPGKVNSVNASNPDNVAPFISSVFPQDSLTLIVIFNEKLDSMSMVNATYSLNNGITIASISYLTDRSVKLIINQVLAKKVTYTLTVTGCKDCVGNEAFNSLYSFILPESAVTGDIVINEILFNPVTGGSDFVEIYNKSDKHINLAYLTIANEDLGITSNYKNITFENRIIKPAEYLVFTKDSNNIKLQYPKSRSGSFIQLAALPNYNDDEGTVIIATLDSLQIDRVYYSDKMHFPLIKITEGVSLERIDFNRPSNDSTNWHSAAENVGFATPGYENSQYMGSAGLGNDQISIEPAIFSPDNDGYNDVLNISYVMPAGYAANITVYDQHGRLIKRLAKNELLGTTGIISWDGIDEDNEKSPIGIYVVYFEAFNSSGDIVKSRKTCVLAVKL